MLFLFFCQVEEYNGFQRSHSPQHFPLRNVPVFLRMSSACAIPEQLKNEYGLSRGSSIIREVETPERVFKNTNQVSRHKLNRAETKKTTTPYKTARLVISEQVIFIHVPDIHYVFL